MVNQIIGRKEEVYTLKEMLSSKNAEFLAIYGRRRIGKTFLIRSFFQKEKVIFFDVTGSKDGPMVDQIRHFIVQIGKVFYKGAKLNPGKNWDETFEILTEAIDSINGNEKIVLFFDEFPWMDTKNSRLIQNLAYYWNQHWSKNDKIKLIICGSSASWIINKIVNNKGGLHNRLTRKIHLAPFKLGETKQYLHSLGIKLNNSQILQIYMVIGGIPYYLSKVERGQSATQNIDKLAFRKKSFLLGEFENLFSSLFSDYEIHIKIIRIIAEHRYGIGQEQLLKKMGKSFQGKGGISKLKDLQDTNFIMSFKPHFNSTRGIYYKVVDQYILFYFSWIEPIRNTLLEKGFSGRYWEKINETPSWNSWAGYAFESICYEHVNEIRECLGLTPTAIPDTWRKMVKKSSKEKGAQIDLLFDRDDNSITICEIKYTDLPFVLDKKYAGELKNKIGVFLEATRTKKQIFLSIISANGLKDTIYSEEMVDSIVTLDDLFLVSPI